MPSNGVRDPPQSVWSSGRDYFQAYPGKNVSESTNWGEGGGGGPLQPRGWLVEGLPMSSLWRTSRSLMKALISSASQGRAVFPRHDGNRLRVLGRFWRAEGRGGGEGLGGAAA